MSVVVCEKPVAPEAASTYFLLLSTLRPCSWPWSETVDVEPPLKEGFGQRRAVCTVPCGNAKDCGLACDEKEAVVCMRNE